jgi:hypothetical protein
MGEMSFMPSMIKGHIVAQSLFPIHPPTNPEFPAAHKLPKMCIKPTKNEITTRAFHPPKVSAKTAVMAASKKTGMKDGMIRIGEFMITNITTPLN